MKTLLLLIDLQNDFIEGGKLAVPGGKAACEFVADWIMENGGKIDEIIATQDDHYTTHIGLPKAWRGDVKPFTTIKSEDVESGKYDPLYISKEEVIRYLKRIETKGDQHIVWPEHCIHGSEGQQFPACILNALNHWSEQKGRHWKSWQKGSYDGSEMYSAFSYADKEVDLTYWMETLALVCTYDKIYIAGLAKDYCVRRTVMDMIDTPTYQGHFDNKIVFLEKGMASINPTSTEATDVYERAVKEFGAVME